MPEPQTSPTIPCARCGAPCRLAPTETDRPEVALLRGKATPAGAGICTSCNATAFLQDPTLPMGQIFADCLPELAKAWGANAAPGETTFRGGWAFHATLTRRHWEGLGEPPEEIGQRLASLLADIAETYLRAHGLGGPARVVAQRASPAVLEAFHKVFPREGDPVEPTPPAKPVARIFRLAGGGALVCDQPIPGVTNDVGEEDARHYGGARHFVAESMNRATARAIAFSLGGVLKEDIPELARIAGVALLQLPAAHGKTGIFRAWDHAAPGGDFTVPVLAGSAGPRTALDEGPGAEPVAPFVDRYPEVLDGLSDEAAAEVRGASSPAEEDRPRARSVEEDAFELDWLRGFLGRDPSCPAQEVRNEVLRRLGLREAGSLLDEVTAADIDFVEGRGR